MHAPSSASDHIHLAPEQDGAGAVLVKRVRWPYESIEDACGYDEADDSGADTPSMVYDPLADNSVGIDCCNGSSVSIPDISFHHCPPDIRYSINVKHSSKIKSLSHDGTLNRISVNGSVYELARRPTTQDDQPYMSQLHQQQRLQRETSDSPDLLNSRQLRRQVARYSTAPLKSDDATSAAGSREGQSLDRGRDGTSDITVLSSLRNAALASWLNVLMIFVPLGYLAHYLRWPVVAVFVLNYLAIIPLSALMGFATEEVCIRLGPTWGGVVNAAFGNAVELIVAVIALIEEEYRIVQAGLIGSVLSNTLLVLGWAFLAGGLRHRVQFFHVEAAQCAGALLALSVLSMIIPAAYHGVHASGGEITNGILIMSRGTALILLVVYILFLVFQLKTHSDIFDGTHTTKDNLCSAEKGYSEDVSPAQSSCKIAMYEGVGAPLGRKDTTSKAATLIDTQPRNVGSSRLGHRTALIEEEIGVMHRECHLRHSAPQMKMWMAAALLSVISGLVALSSDILVDSVQELTSHYNISHTFVGMILLPIAANAAEHTMSVTVAIRNKMDLCITVAVGSSMQMTLFVLPVLITIAWILNRPLTLFFDDFETTTMLISVLVINYLIMNGRSNWLKGAMLLSSYFIVALAFFLYPNELDNPKGGIATGPAKPSFL
ncbi:hypothetical protein GGI04_001371 [Coemansia thaxteri]|uniref:Sodium/calcium exchanger membrane region domain-containing protein n=1 Tax=Coemansia thaxteri TaxID=2663907 RepID=A0A9W8BEY6_9FUNG|nr:hypothetical protein H4R26_005056 [Coemansia thaxteri]KAJ2007844.1 hypothetical protein GGI04_001371 [Coemansia thaxteri]KAJ2472428.1 hypothetical protein GGI02_001584 [Coemansia sp. RSA 2322]KAJ2484295.1 hypothetical protein EV174_002540 [Coemansia sp. RSA 2320]